MAKNWLINKLDNIKKYEARFGRRQAWREERFREIFDKCLERRSRGWCEKRLGMMRVVYKLDQVHKRIVAIMYQETLRQLEFYYRKQWLNQSAYDIIKADINYLIRNL